MKKITRTQALIRWNAEKPFVAVPNKCNPKSLHAIKVDLVRPTNFTFFYWENLFRFYNCNDELGNEIAFYEDEDTAD